jgi:Putative auto-transporter adhesin, head GIN domain
MARRTLPLLGLSLALLAACGPTGSGDIVSEERLVSPTAVRIEVSGGIALRFTVDPEADFAVTVHYDDNVIDRIKTEVVGDTLRIYNEGNYSTFGGGDRFVEVTVNSLLGLEASGGSSVLGQGEASTVEVEASGGADVDLGTLPVAEMTLQASGGANVVVNVTQAITGEASGGADVLVQGEPAQQSLETSGGAEVSYG